MLPYKVWRSSEQTQILEESRVGIMEGNMVGNMEEVLEGHLD